MNEQLLETRVTLLEKRIREMEKILTTNNLFLKEAQVPSPTFESWLKRKTDRSLGIQMVLLNPKPVQENGKGNNCD